MNRAIRAMLRVLMVTGLLATGGWLQGGETQVENRPLGVLPSLEKEPDAKQVALGRMLFFDGRLSGDDKVSCATCHDPIKAWTDGLPMSEGYPGSHYFRNTPTLLNSAHGFSAYWDGRLLMSDLETVVRDHISEAHFMQADGRVVIERLRQVPEYEQGFKEAFGGEPSYGRLLTAVAGFVKTLRSAQVPFDRYLQGEKNALSAEAERGVALFKGKAGCVRCHDGPLLSDSKFHRVGLPASGDIFAVPERHITFRRFFRTLGIAEYALLREDLGHYGVTKQERDRGRFRTPSLREVSRTPPYMHDGSLPTLEAIVDFYDRGGGRGTGKDPRLRPLGLRAQEKRELIAFLESLSGALPVEALVIVPPYAGRKLGEN